MKKKVITLGLSVIMATSIVMPVFANGVSESIEVSNGGVIHEYASISTLDFRYVSQEEIARFDDYVIVENGIFVISQEGYLNLSESELDRLNEILDNTNSNVKISKMASKYYFV